MKTVRSDMLNVQFFTFNAFAENTYIISDQNNQCWIVDPGMSEKRETDAFISFIERKEFKPVSIINTHAHLDHIFGVQFLKDKYGIPFGIHQAEVPVLKRGADTAAMFGIRMDEVPEADFFIQDGTRLQLGANEIDVLFTPGHSPGSISFYHRPGDWIISGDVLFDGSIGRTDLPGGNFDTLATSIRTQLYSLPDITTVLSGHGDATTIGKEKKSNPFVKG